MVSPGHPQGPGSLPLCLLSLGSAVLHGLFRSGFHCDNDDVVNLLYATLWASGAPEPWPGDGSWPHLPAQRPGWGTLQDSPKVACGAQGKEAAGRPTCCASGPRGPGHAGTLPSLIVRKRDIIAKPRPLPEHDGVSGVEQRRASAVLIVNAQSVCP